ncbi:probable WRKY transcription factor 20 isoform X2 [Ricinus communis]|uniref:probable WRKY transcription factor 20 isoform X2 n=1 Tax=Ricinus communis TaxID=3988 RepID=UPI00201A3A3A|nr:probable WRKY transcription factor 20 isoform X2 [Ricinus communis]
MSEVSPASSRDPSMENEEENREEEDVDRGGHRLVLPEDGYEWRKYGQKFIKNIGKFRLGCTFKDPFFWKSDIFPLNSFWNSCIGFGKICS